MVRGSVVVAALLQLGVLSLVSVAEGQPSVETVEALEQAKRSARSFADQGFEHFEAGRHEEAIAAFSAAYERYRAPTLLLMIAQASEKLGRLVEARAHYQQVIDEQLTHYAPKEFYEAQVRAKVDLEALDARIPVVEVAVSGAPADEVTLLVDGKAASAGVVRLNPGEHALQATAPGREGVRRSLTLAEGERVQVTLALAAPEATLGPAPHALPSPAPAPPAAPPSAATERSSRPYLIPALGAFGLAGVAAVVCAVTGEMSLNATESLGGECVGARCYDDAGGATYDRARTLGAVSTVSFVVASAATVAGATLLLWPSTTAAEPKAALHVSPAWVGVQGTF
ncbi:hypothetical protein [Chondromyces crocatus]|uniref:PEGA domain-containing protein n=1 Tax=Chondromyces crocatus TaxID=52 RepID=A0A0K1E9X1_CHOCO|nr:hypothetical protein [Chondromyces crocatus]AKT37383.1 uncharacterized protein CMC5_015180 [Chondromyces crocatus]